MITVWKYHIAMEATRVSAPHPHKFLHFAFQGNFGPVIWVQVNTELSKVDRAYAITGTGHPLLDPWSLYLATIIHEGFVWHLWELPA
jgi:hypothetical protein